MNSTLPVPVAPARPAAPPASDHPPLAYGITAAAAAAGVGRDMLYRAIRDDRLTARKVGARTVILADELKRWLASMPAIPPRHRAAPLAPTGDLP